MSANSSTSRVAAAALVFLSACETVRALDLPIGLSVSAQGPCHLAHLGGEADYIVTVGLATETGDVHHDGVILS